MYSFLKTLLNTKAGKITLLILVCGTKLLAQNITANEKEFPTPTGNPQQLFYLQRTENTNTVVYELNEPNGNLDTDNPIHIFWIMYAKQKQQQELTEVEKKFAYGIKIKPANKEQYEFTLVAYPKINLQLTKNAKQKYGVYTSLNGQSIILHRVYIKVKETEFALKPTVEYVELSGTDVISGKEITKRITP
jgi:phosphatidylinositol phosphate synthase